MIHFLYNIIIYIFGFLIQVISFWDSKAKKRIIGLNKQKAIIDNLVITKPVIWTHCASLGEFEQGRSLIEQLRLKYTNHFFLLTFFSSSGYENTKNYKGADLIAYLPLDTPKNSKVFISKFNPVVSIFVKYDLWFNFIKTAKNQNTSLFLVSAKLNPSFLYEILLKKIIPLFTKIYCQDKKTLDFCTKNGNSQTIIETDTRFDRVSTNSSLPFENQFIENFIKSTPVIVAGSVWLKDIILLKKSIQTIPNIKWIIVPHEIDSKNIQNIQEHIQSKTSLYSKKIIDSNLLIIDEIGILSKLYRHATICYIGGGFDNGIHNTLEAAVYGKPILFGPKFSKFKEANDLIKSTVAFPIKNPEETVELMKNLLQDKPRLDRIHIASKKYIKQNLGASKRICDDIIKLTEPSI